jgi:hypothetical protein
MYQERFWTRLGKHVPVARQQILNNATVGPQQWKSCGFCVSHADMLWDEVSLVIDRAFGTGGQARAVL